MARTTGKHEPAHAAARVRSPQEMRWQAQRLRWAGISAVAAVLALAIITTALFASRLPFRSRGAATPTPNDASLPGAIYAVSMDSSTDGWALGQSTNAQGQIYETLYHYDGTQWVYRGGLAGFAAESLPITLQMVATNDGWAYDGRDHLFHYDGAAWRSASITLPASDGIQGIHIQSLFMRSSTEGYASAYLSGGVAGRGEVGFLRYDGQHWTLDAGAFSWPDGIQDPSQEIITAFTAAPGGAVWAMGMTTQAMDQGAPPSVTYVFQRTSSGWQRVYALTGGLLVPGSSLNAQAMVMTGPDSGWIAGEVDKLNANPAGGGPTTLSQVALLRFDGSRWTPQPLTPAFTSPGDKLTQIVASGPNSVWVAGQSSAAVSLQPGGIAVHALLLHYDGVNWTRVTPNGLTDANSATVLAIGQAGSADLWAVGECDVPTADGSINAYPLFWRYDHGSWHATHGRPAGAQTAATLATTGVTLQTGLQAVSMLSPTDGWAMGNRVAIVQSDYSGPVPPSEILFYHYDGSQWILKQQAPDAGMPYSSTATGARSYGGQPSIPTLQMLSATDGWAIDDSNHLLRYDGAKWRFVTISLSGNAQVGPVLAVLALNMVSPTEGWAAALLEQGPTGPGSLGFLRYDGHAWTLDKSLVLSGADMTSSTISAISALPGGDVWAVSSVTASDQGTDSMAGLVFQRLNGVWTVASELNQPNAARYFSPSDIYMASPTSGWIVGETHQNVASSSGPTDVTHPFLLRYDFHTSGSAWTPVDAPLNDNTFSPLQITGSGPDNLWINNQPAGGLTPSTGSAIQWPFLHYDGQSWSTTPQNLPVSGMSGMTTVKVLRIGVVPDGGLWAVGYGQQTSGVDIPLIWLYRNGAWSEARVTGK